MTSNAYAHIIAIIHINDNKLSERSKWWINELDSPGINKNDNNNDEGTNSKEEESLANQQQLTPRPIEYERHKYV